MEVNRKAKHRQSYRQFGQQGWGFTVQQGGRTTHEDSDAYINHHLQSDREGRFDHIRNAVWRQKLTHTVILTDSMPVAKLEV